MEEIEDPKLLDFLVVLVVVLDGDRIIHTLVELVVVILVGQMTLLLPVMVGVMMEVQIILVLNLVQVEVVVLNLQDLLVDPIMLVETVEMV